MEYLPVVSNTLRWEVLFSFFTWSEIHVYISAGTVRTVYVHCTNCTLYVQCPLGIDSQFALLEDFSYLSGPFFLDFQGLNSFFLK